MSNPSKICVPFNQALAADLKEIRGVCLDIDDTLSTEGKLTAEAYQALWKLKRAGFFVVPITGRPAGWCDHIARFWPVDAVVGENGAFSFYLDGNIRKRMETPAGKSPEMLKKNLAELSLKIKNQFPEAVWASDQAYREYDLAIDICEDVKPWPPQRTEELLAFCQAQGAQAKLSSIHVNTWFGNYNKNDGLNYLLESKTLPLPEAHSRWLYIGDSPNDEPMFEAFSHSVGVANIQKYLPRFKFPPRWITQHESGSGFSEMVEHLLKQRGFSH